MMSRYRIYAMVLNARLERKMEEEKKLEETQMGCRKWRGTIDFMYYTKWWKRNWKKRAERLAFFMVLSTALDRVEREKVMENVGGWENRQTFKEQEGRVIVEES
uniref:Uncharacterized protein n=1 Tax=Photinus pyralis TaxID=7054 RepID=A0A1Y1M1Z1_PHOPY